MPNPLRENPKSTKADWLISCFAVYLQGKEWHITAVKERTGRELSAAEKLFNLPEQAQAAKTILEAFAQSLTIHALETGEMQQSGIMSAAVSTLPGEACMKFCAYKHSALLFDQ